MTNIHTQTWQKILLSLSQSGPFTLKERSAYRLVADEALKRMQPLEQCVLKFLYMSPKKTLSAFKPILMEEPEFEEALKTMKTTFADIVAEIQKNREWLSTPPKAPRKKVTKKPQPDTRSQLERLLDSSIPMNLSACVAIFGLPFDCHIDLIKSRYRALVKLYHPDLTYDPDAKELATVRTSRINEAKAHLFTFKKHTGC